MRFSSNFLLLSLFFVPFSLGQYSDYETKNFTVPLDHFSMTDERTFAIRYLINDKFWLPHCGPIFLYTGNEGPIEELAESTAFLWEAAIKFKGLVVFAEHRYYGSSRPFPNMSEKSPPEDLAYLSTLQALADFVDLVYELKSNYQKAGSQTKDDKSKRSNAVIAIGGSYGGMLAAWMRMKYPAVVEGALASSAPVFQFLGMNKPCESYFKILTDEYRTIGGQPCVDNIKRSWPVIRDTLKDDKGKEQIKNTWKLCTPIKTPEHIEEFVQKVSSTYVNIGQYNYPYPTDFTQPLPANPVKAICDHLSNPRLSDNDLLMAIRDAVSQFNLDEKTKCFQWQGGSDPSLDALDHHFYSFQTCTELVTATCSTDSELFEPFSWNFTEYSQGCLEDFKVKPKEKYDEKLYGGKDLRYASNIIFSNGGYDPWSGAGVLDSKGLPPSVIVQFMPDAAHHLDLRADNAADPPSVKNARKLYIQTFRDWITNYLKQHEIADEEYLKQLSTI